VHRLQLAVASGRAMDACQPADGRVSRRPAPRAAAGPLPRLRSGLGDSAAVAPDGLWTRAPCPWTRRGRRLPAYGRPTTWPSFTEGTRREQHVSSPATQSAPASGTARRTRPVHPTRALYTTPSEDDKNALYTTPSEDDKNALYKTPSEDDKN